MTSSPGFWLAARMASRSEQSCGVQAPPAESVVLVGMKTAAWAAEAAAHTARETAAARNTLTILRIMILSPARSLAQNLIAGSDARLPRIPRMDRDRRRGPG